MNNKNEQTGLESMQVEEDQLAKNLLAIDTANQDDKANQGFVIKESNVVEAQLSSEAWVNW